MIVTESILEVLHEPVLILDGSLHAIYANRTFRESLEMIPGQWEGKPIQELLRVENGQAGIRTALETMTAQSGRVENTEVVCMIPPNQRKTFSLNARRIIVDEDHGEMVIVELRETTADKRAKQRIKKLNETLRRHVGALERINSELESFTHSVSHDLRSPLRLTNKIGNLLLEEHEADLPAGAIEKIRMILTSTEEMTRLIEDLLRFSRISREPMKKRRVDLSRLARQVVEKLRKEGQGGDVEIAIEAMPICLADRALLKQVFLNLIGNAIKFAQPGREAKVHVGSEEMNGQTVYYVRDNGVGFDAKYSESMFLAFNKLHRSGEFEGSGIGLALVRRIIERHGGRVWAEGAIDSGAKISFTLGEPTVG